MSRWFRAYDDALDDPKVQRLSGDLFKAWFNLMCVTSKNDGQPFDIKEVEFRLRVKRAKATAIISALVDAGLIDPASGGYYVSHNWDARQFKTDNADPTNADRQKRYRDRHRVTEETVTPTVTVTPTRAETEQITEKDDAPSGASKFAFESGRIRLSAKNLAQWKAAFLNLDLEAELLGLSDWAEKQGSNWFVAVSGALAKRNREIGLRQKQQNGPKVALFDRPYTDFIT